MKIIKHIALTGSSGFIGFHLTKKLLDHDLLLYLITNRPELINSNIKNHKNIKIIKGDIGQESVQYMIINNKIDLIVNLYAQTDLYYAEHNIIQDFNINVLPIVKLFSFLSIENYKCTFIQIGTVTQCGLTPSTPINETFIDNPETVFDYHKLCAENYVKYYNNNKGIKGFCFRLSNVYGGSNILYSANRGVINKVINRALTNKTITLFGDGNYLRDYIHIDDVVSCIYHSINSNEKLLGKHVLLCKGKSHTISEVWNLIAILIEELYSIKITVENEEWPNNYLEIEKRSFVADNSLLVDSLCIELKRDLKESLRENIKMIYKNL